MTLTPQSPNQATGSRRLTLTMLTARDRADGFAGLPADCAKPLRLLIAFQQAEPYLGLPAHAFKLVSWLVKMTMPCDWQEGSRPIVWPSARLQQEYLGLSATRVKALNRALFEADIFVIRDNEQGKRYGRRGPDGRIIEAYGFDLTPLAQRYDEFVRIAAEAKIERDRMKALRKRATIARRAIRQVGEALEALGPLPPGWSRLAAETADLVKAGRRAACSEELELVVKALEGRKTEAEQWLRDMAQPVNPDPAGAENGPHTTTTNNQSIHPCQDTVIATEDCSPALAEPKTATPTLVCPEKALRIKPAELIDLAPRLAQYIPPGLNSVTWSHVLDAADYLRGDLGVSRSLWAEACQSMGRDQAALALAIVSTKPEAHFSRSAGGYFAGMVRKHQKGELHLQRSLWALREAKYGKASRRSMN
jgi:replication initiation protein RepC